jgi:competence protein ComEC
MRLPLRLRGAILEGGFHPIEGGALVTVRSFSSEATSWLVGDRLLISLTLKPFHNFNNPGGHDYVLSQAEKGYFARGFIGDERSIVKLAPEERAFPFYTLDAVARGLDLFRRNARMWLQKHLEPDTAAFYGALLLGYPVPQNWAEHLSRTGVSHLLSISGLHLALVSMITFWIFRRLVRLMCPSLLKKSSDQFHAIWAAFFAAVLYALISGLALPTWRAAVMLAFSCGALVWQRSSDTISALAGAALLILLIDPTALKQISFQLSFAAVLGLLLFYPRFRKFQAPAWEKSFLRRRPVQKLLKPFTDAFLVSAAANVTTLPLVAYHFHGISLAGFAANTVLVPAVGFLVLPPGLLSLSIYPVSEHLAVPFLKLGGLFLGYCQQLILWFSNLSWAFFWVGNIPLVCMAAVYLGLAVWLSAWSRGRKALVPGVLVLLTTGVIYLGFGPGGAYDGKHLQVTAVDVGQGTSTLIRFPTGETMLVDGGGFYDDSFDIGKSVLAPFLWYSGIRKLDYVVLSHDHPDHRNGLRFILSNFDVGSFWESGLLDTEKPGDLAAIAERRRIPVRRLAEIRGEHHVGQCAVRVMHPDRSYLVDEWDRQDLNNISLVLQVSYKDTTVILPGDIDQSVERLLFANYPIRPGKVLLLSPHHGSRRSNSALMLDRLVPRAVIFSCGYENHFGFPSTEVLSRCAERGIPIYRTDISGAVHSVSDGRKWTLDSQTEQDSLKNLSFRKHSRQPSKTP